MLSAGAAILFKISSLVQLRRRTSDVVMVTVCGKHSDFMTNVVIVFIISPLLDQGLGLPQTDRVKKEPEK